MFSVLDNQSSPLRILFWEKFCNDITCASLRELQVFVVKITTRELERARQLLIIIYRLSISVEPKYKKFFLDKRENKFTQINLGKDKR